MSMSAAMHRPVILQEPENVSVGELEHSSSILEAVEAIRKTFKKSPGSSLIFEIDGKNPSTDSRCGFFRGINFGFLDDYLNNSDLEDHGKAASEFSYRIYSVPEKYSTVIGAVLGILCSKYHRLHLETPDGIVTWSFGEYFPNRE